MEGEPSKEFLNLLNSIEMRIMDTSTPQGSGIQNILHRIDDNLQWNTVLDKYSLLLSQFNQIEGALKQNEELLKHTTLLPKERHERPEYVPELMSVYMPDMDDLNQPVLDVSFDSNQIIEHNNFCSRLQDEFLKQLKTTNFKYKPKQIEKKSENPLLESIFTGKGLKKEVIENEKKKRSDTLRLSPKEETAEVKVPKPKKRKRETAPQIPHQSHIDLSNSQQPHVMHQQHSTMMHMQQPPMTQNNYNNLSRQVQNNFNVYFRPQPQNPTRPVQGNQNYMVYPQQSQQPQQNPNFYTNPGLGQFQQGMKGQQTSQNFQRQKVQKMNQNQMKK
eukprot:gene1523-12649_t